MNKVGIIAGSGTLPVIAAKNAKNSGYEVYSVCFKNHTSGEIEKYSKFKYFSIGNFSGPIDFLKENGVGEVILLGTVSHINVFRDLRPDIRAAKFLFNLKNKTPIEVLKSVSAELEKEGIKVVDSTLFLKELIAKKGLITGKASEEELKQIEYGFKIAKNIADMDIGLAVAIKDYSVIAVEAIEGTDECIKRAGELLKGKKFILIKVSRTNQDFRFDLPVIGHKTIENAAKAGCNLIAVESLKTIIVDIDKTVETAKRLDVSILGF